MGSPTRFFRWWCQRRGYHRWMVPLDPCDVGVRTCATCWHQEGLPALPPLQRGSLERRLIEFTDEELKLELKHRTFARWTRR